MIPTSITKAHIADAIRCILRDGFPARRRGRSYCLVTEGGHLPPKYTIALAHQIATGGLLHSDEFSGGRESNEFLRRHGFEVVECACGGSVRSGRVAPVLPPPGRRKHSGRPGRHSENCAACKTRVGELLERIYGKCVRDHRFGWKTGLAAYATTPIGSALRDVAKVLKANRGYGISTFVRTDKLAGCDYWVPDPGFIVEFDESQHFTRPRKLAFSAYRDRYLLGFSARRWVKLCEQYDAKDNDPPYRDEQRAWYDTLRDLIPLVAGLEPTVRLYARDRVWCSLDPDSSEDRESFSNLIRQGRSSTSHPKAQIQTSVARSESTLRVGMVFPPVAQQSSDGVPPAGAGAQQPVVPAASAFMREALDFVLFPEGYISATDHPRTESLQELARDLRAPLLVGAVDRSVDSTGRAWQVLLRFDPDGSRTRLYTKHSTADAIAFERPDWDPGFMLPTFELGGVTAGATICHDHYLGLLPRHLAQHGVRLWVNPSFDNVTDIKWASILRLRAVENRFFSLSTLHYDVKRKRTHPFAFSPDGTELWARQAGSEAARPLSECSEAGSIYVIDLDMAAAGSPLDWSKLPPAKTPKRPRNGKLLKPVRAAVRRGHPTILGSSGRVPTDAGFRVETARGPVYVGLMPGEQLLDAAACFRVLCQAKQVNCAPILWNHWERLPADSALMATLMLGRAIECCAPVLLSDGDGIHELVELANKVKIPTRRVVEPSGDAIVDLGYAWGLDNAFKMVTRHVPAGMRGTVLDLYRSLA